MIDTLANSAPAGIATCVGYSFGPFAPCTSGINSIFQPVATECARRPPSRPGYVSA